MPHQQCLIPMWAWDYTEIDNEGWCANWSHLKKLGVGLCLQIE